MVFIVLDAIIIDVEAAKSSEVWVLNTPPSIARLEGHMTESRD